MLQEVEEDDKDDDPINKNEEAEIIELGDKEKKDIKDYDAEKISIDALDETAGEHAS